MKISILIFTVILTLFVEIIYIDPLFWKRSKSDKPLSHVFWFMLISVIAVLWQFVFIWNWALSVIFMALAFRFSLFDYCHNLVYKHEPFYLGNDLTALFKKRLAAGRLPLEAFIILVAIMQYLYFNCSIYCDNTITILGNLPRFITNF